MTSINFNISSRLRPEDFVQYCSEQLNIKSLGYKKIEIFGAKIGAYSRKDSLTTEDFEMLVVAEK